MISLFNMFWFVLCGWLNALVMLVASACMAVTIIGWPIAKVLFNLASLGAFPYGKEIIRETELNGKNSVGGLRKFGGLLANILFLPFGIAIAIFNVLMAGVLAITVIGIPFAVVYLRLAKFIIWPVGAKVVTNKQAMASAVANELGKRLA